MKNKKVIITALTALFFVNAGYMEVKAETTASTVIHAGSQDTEYGPGAELLKIGRASCRERV